MSSNNCSNSTDANDTRREGDAAQQDDVDSSVDIVDSNSAHQNTDHDVIRTTTTTATSSHQHQHQHQHFKMYKPAKVLTQFVYTHRKRRKRTLLGDVISLSSSSSSSSSCDNTNNNTKTNSTNSSTNNNNNNNNMLPKGNNLMAIGRLDEDSEGLLLLTTDGKLSERVRRKSIEKEYWVQVRGAITDEAMERLRGGVDIRVPSSSSTSKSTATEMSTEMYTTLPCKARRLETKTETIMIVETKNDNDVRCDAANSKEQSSSNNIQSTKRRKRSFKGKCNVCGMPGHKSRDCNRNPVDHALDHSKYGKEASSSSSSSSLLTSTSASLHSSSVVVSLPQGIPPPSKDNNSACCPRVGSHNNNPTTTSSWVSLTITEGKNRQVRRMTAAVGHPTLRLVRVRIGRIALDGMVAGEVRTFHPLDV